MLKLILLSISLTFAGGSLDSLLNSGKPLKILGIWCHPDDEFFSATIAAKKLPNVEIVALNLKDGRDEQCLTGVVGGDTLYSRGCPCPIGITSCPDTMGKFRLSRMVQAKSALGLKNRFFPLDSLILARDTAVAVDSLYKWIKGYNPDILLTHNLAGDYISSLSGANKRDHALVSALVYSAYKRLSVKPLFYMSVYNYRRDSGKLLQAQAVGAPSPTDSIDAGGNWALINQAGQLYDGSGFYLDIARVGVKWQKNWFYKVQ